MKSVFLLTNFSETSLKAIDRFMIAYGPKLSKDYIFYLINAWMQPRTGHSQLINLDEFLFNFSTSDLERSKSRILNLFKEKKPRIKPLSIKGEIVDVINRLAEEHRPELIVIGSKGSNVLLELITSGTTRRILRQCNLPTMIIPEYAPFIYPERIVFASDLQECKNTFDFEKIALIARWFMAEFMILHIYREEKPDVEAFEKCIERYLEGINYSFHYHQHVDIAEGISQFTMNMKAGLLSMICRNDSLISVLFKNSVAGSLALQAKLPMLIIHE